MQYRVAPACQRDRSELPQRNKISLLVLQQEPAERFRIEPVDRIQNHRDTENPVSVVGLRNLGTLIRSADGGEHIEWLKRELDQAIGLQPDQHLGHSPGSLDSDVDTPTNSRQDSCGRVAGLIKNIKVIAEDAYDHVSPLAREGLLDAFGKERIQAEVKTGESSKNSANSCLGLIDLFAGGRPYRDIELAFVRSYGILAKLRPSGALSDAFDIAVTQQRHTDLTSDSH